MEDETIVTPEDPVISEESKDGNTTINVYVPAAPAAAEVSDETGTETGDTENAESFENYSVYSAVDPVAADRSGMSSVIGTIFGDYQPRTQTVTVTASDGGVTTTTQLVPGVAGMDMVWIAGVISFLVVLSGFISLLRVVIRHE